MRWTATLAVLAASWGLITVLVDSVALGAPVLALHRLALAALTLALVAALTQTDVSARGNAGTLGLLGALQAVHWVLFFEAVKLGSVALAVMTFYTAPVILAIAAPILLSEPTRRVALAALPLGSAGVALVALAGDGGTHASASAITCGLGSAATYAALVLVSKRLLRDGTPPLTVALWDCAVGALVLVPVVAIADRVVPSTTGDWAAVLALGVVFTGLSTLVYAASLRHVSAQSAGLLTFLEPVAAVVLAAALLDNPVSVKTAIGGALVLTAGLLVVGDSASAATRNGSRATVSL
ncbi:MAG: DMT family transporter [Gaiellales bacterium]